ncbi:RNA polymerase 2 transcriptional [Niveomyces insectorum RCEF 264]|uniref:RNA polymerase 2 transcriptional n=1 Tax=Niveomyces insectorum RCEF 264 TaxID=1081102 RepID=A0A167VES7_9HYPO|nr:RNA polymerase 2 transcriptional [Niveomyces insectorum RCEF 264]
MGDRKRAFDADDAGGSASASGKVAKTAAGGDAAVNRTKRKSSGGGSGSSSAGAPPKGQDAEGNVYWELSKARRIGIAHFRNNTLINIREYYDSAGQMRPGKKGISLSLEQYKTLLRAIPQINAALRDDGVAMDDVDDEVGGGAADDDNARAESSTKPRKAPKKANHEATSDEDEG